MTPEKVKEVILGIFDEFGIYLDASDAEADIDLREYIVDSLQFIYFIVELEERLNISIPDEFLTYDSVSSINGFTGMMIKLLENTEESLE